MGPAILKYLWVAEISLVTKNIAHLDSPLIYIMSTHYIVI